MNKTTKTKISDKQMLHAAFKRLRKQGIKASLGVGGCCRSCIWYEMTQVGTKPWADVPVVWFYTGQGNQLKYDFEDKLVSHQTLYLGHNSDLFPEKISEAVEILREAGLNASWNGEGTSCITIDLP